MFDVSEQFLTTEQIVGGWKMEEVPADNQIALKKHGVLIGYFTVFTNREAVQATLSEIGN